MQEKNYKIPKTLEAYEELIKNNNRGAFAGMIDNNNGQYDENTDNLQDGKAEVFEKNDVLSPQPDDTALNSQPENSSATADVNTAQPTAPRVHYQQYSPQFQPTQYQPYYQSIPASNPPYNTAQKPKLSTGAKWMIGLLIALLVLSFAGYILFLGVSATNRQQEILNQLISPTEPTTSAFSTEPTTAPKQDNTVPVENSNSEKYTDKSFKGITLSDLPSDKANSSKYTTQNIYNAVSKSIVAVMCYNDSIPNETSTAKPVSQGTGIIVTENGYIVTNSHVIGNKKSYKIQIVTNDGNKLEAAVVGYDTRTDLAVLKAEAKNLKPASFGNSDKVEVGQDVIAVGNPGGIDFQNSLTKGIISAKNRKMSTSGTVRYLQTDAAINPGNSGGPLCNMYGQVIGINTVKIVSTQYEGMGFSIPSNTVKEIIDDIIRQGFVSGRVRIGITGTPVTSTLQEGYGLPAGIIIQSVSDDGPLAGTDVKQGDIITAVDDRKISSFADIYAILAEHKAGDKVELSFYRVSGTSDKDKEFKLKITLAEDNGDTQQ